MFSAGHMESHSHSDNLPLGPCSVIVRSNVNLMNNGFSSALVGNTALLNITLKHVGLFPSLTEGFMDLSMVLQLL